MVAQVGRDFGDHALGRHVVLEDAHALFGLQAAENVRETNDLNTFKLRHSDTP